MSNFQTKFNQNHTPDIGTLLDESFNTFKKTVWISGVGTILMVLFILPISFFILASVFEIDSLQEFAKMSPTLAEDFNYILTNAAVSIPLSALVAPLTAGIYKINHLAKQNKEFSFSNLFDYYNGKYFFNIASCTFLIGLYSNVLGLGLIYLKLTFVATNIQLLVSFLFMLAIPLIIFENQNALTAMSNSSKITIKHPFTIIVCIILAVIISLLGLFALCLGIFFTVGYIYTMNYSIYNAIIPVENSSSFDEIGKE
ncbi:hypothetical protein [Flavobacterium difficile]|uniref:Beta-carotene 15,15'-monooxygenase n=1 Tax=Flavobacterium difficile TaxID=2709659 RepID=A0ABX0I4R4_9FLAO|nr:hypothetical protein [Flavobacterium difficile]NHM02183.1 hypothetical protein [Flavobacterium difficile]